MKTIKLYHSKVFRFTLILTRDDLNLVSAIIEAPPDEYDYYMSISISSRYNTRIVTDDIYAMWILQYHEIN